MTPELVDHLLRFLLHPANRTYIITYAAGAQLCRAYVAGQPQRLRRLLASQVRVGDLLVAAGGAVSLGTDHSAVS